DACREATDGAKSIGLEDTRNAVERAGIVTFFSCDSKDKSYEIDQLQHGSFTHCILEAITSKCCNTVDELDQYLRTNVPLTNSKYRKPPQQPYAIIQPAEKGKLPIFFSRSQEQQVKDKWLSFEDRLG